MSDFFYLGIDPGIVNTGWCLRSPNSKSSAGGVFNPSKSTSLVHAADDLYKLVYDSRPTDAPISVLAIERFVAYKGVMTADSEKVLMLIGSLLHKFHSCGTRFVTCRAIDWKPVVSKDLYKTKDFRNPSDKLDKKFSIAAAGAILGREFKTTDHEADAVCLSYYAQLKGV